MSDKPPVGLRPQWLVLSDRANEIRAAMQRYSAQALLCPDEWLIELQEIERQQAILNPLRRTPQPKPPAKDFKPGQVWRTRKGMECKIIEIAVDDDDDVTLARSDLYTRHWHYLDGKSVLAINGRDHGDDLVSLISEPEPEPEPEPVATPPATEIPEPIRAGAALFYVVVCSDDSGGAGGGKPITWETQIPEGSSLQAVLQQQARVGNRYGTTFIAECRIIPELTREVGQ